MGKGNEHIIRKVSLSVADGDISNAFQLKEEAYTWWHNELLPALKRELDEIDLENEIVQIPKLDIVVDTEKRNNWQEKALQKIIADVKLQLQSKILPVQQQATTAKRILEERDKIQNTSLVQHFISVLSNYLLSGILPWQEAVQTKEQFIARIRENLTKEEFKNYREQLLIILRENKVAQSRLLYLFDKPAEIDEIFIVLIPGINKDVLISWHKSINAIVTKAPDHAAEIRTKADRALSAVAFQKHADITRALIVAFRILLTNTLQHYIPVKQIREIIVEEPFEIERKKVAADVTTTNDLTKSPKPSLQHTEEEILTEKELHEILEKNILDKSTTEDTTNKIVKEAVEEGVFISNAGLVLAAPFLSTLFEHTKLVTDLKINNIDKAVCLAGYVATGKKAQVEFELVLPKILCGVPLEQVIDTSIILDDELLKEADEMLNSLIGYWSTIKNTSLEGLREAFLQRDGKISFKKEEWLLQVEQKPYDMLLHQIPWNYSWIKLPWMTNLLKTEWAG